MKVEKEYIQFSKRVTRWGMILMTFSLMCCLSIIAFCGLGQDSISAIVSLYTAFSTVIGVLVGAYQGNSSLEKWVKGKYKFEEILGVKKEEKEEESAG